MSRSFRLFLSIASGVLLSLAWLGFPDWLLFIGWLPLLKLDQFFVERKDQYSGVSFWGHAILTLLIWNGLSTWWIAYATLPGAIMAIAANSFLMSMVWWLGHTARRRFGSNLGYLALTVFWISFEFFHFHWDIEWPWLNLGNGFANSVKLIQWYEYTGTLGGTLWVLTVNILLFRVYKNLMQRSPRKAVLYPAVAFAILLVGPSSWSVWKYYSYTEKENPLNVVVVQPNIDPYDEEYDLQAESRKLQKFIGLATLKTGEQTDLVIGPETVFERYPDWNIDRLDYNFLFGQLVEWIGNYPRAELIFGASTYKIYPDRESASPTFRISNDIFYDVFNSAIFINRQESGSVYHKSILVSGVEKMPFRKYLGFLNDLVFDLGGTTGSLGRQDEPENFVLKNGEKVAPVICYESVFGGYLTSFVRKGAGLIVVITNDGWWKNTPGYRQHLSFARLRSIETRRSMARSANTGISCFINQRGDILKATEWWEDAVIEETVNLNDKMTFYVKYGDYLGRISLYMSVLLLLLMIVKRFVKA